MLVIKDAEEKKLAISYYWLYKLFTSLNKFQTFVFLTNITYILSLHILTALQ